MTIEKQYYADKRIDSRERERMRNVGVNPRAQGTVMPPERG